jgi:nucleoid-associated protein YgaU
MMATSPANAQPGMVPVRVGQNEPPAPPTAPAAVQGTPYTVRPSDTLSSIAAAHYGTKSKKAVEAIYEANRNALPNMNSLKVGAILTIPKLAEAGPEKPQSAAKQQPGVKVALVSDKSAEPKARETEKIQSKKEASEKKSAKKSESMSDAAKGDRNFKWYQVKKNDRFASIARDQLGDASRWHEVYEMNKDKFPDPQHIREGVRIKLPIGEALASASKEKEKTR